jgi:hypothetical protein
MTDHPITPPPELVKQWLGTYFSTTITGEVSDIELTLATQAARWGADQELEACCQWQDTFNYQNAGNLLRSARRPKPPSLKAQALGLLNEGPVSDLLDDEVAVIRRALESLHD